MRARVVFATLLALVGACGGDVCLSVPVDHAASLSDEIAALCAERGLRPLDSDPELAYALFATGCAEPPLCRPGVVCVGSAERAGLCRPAPVFEVILDPTTTRLRADGLDATEVSVSVLAPNSAPPEFGAEVIVFCVNDRGEPAGWMGGPESGQTRLLLNQVGLGGIVLSCDGEPDEAMQLRCLGSYEAAEGTMAPVDCVPVE